VGPRAGLDVEVRGKILCLCRGSNPSRTVRSLIELPGLPYEQWQSINKLVSKQNAKIKYVIFLAI
jgi:hypothetical protein